MRPNSIVPSNDKPSGHLSTGVDPGRKPVETTPPPRVQRQRPSVTVDPSPDITGNLASDLHAPPTTGNGHRSPTSGVNVAVCPNAHALTSPAPITPKRPIVSLSHFSRHAATHSQPLAPKLPQTLSDECLVGSIGRGLVIPCRTSAFEDRLRSLAPPRQRVSLAASRGTRHDDQGDDLAPPRQQAPNATAEVAARWTSSSNANVLISERPDSPRHARMEPAISRGTARDGSRTVAERPMGRAGRG